MELKIESAVLSDALKTLGRLSAAESVTLEVGKRIYLHSVGELNRCRIRLPGKPTGEATFAVSTQSLRDAVAGRKDLTLRFKNNNLIVRSGTYSTTLPTLDSSLAEFGKAEGSTVEVEAEHGAWLKKAASDVAIKFDTLVLSYAPVGIQATKKGTTVVCYTNTHMAGTSNKTLKGSFEFMLPLDTMQTLLDVFHIAPFTLTVSENAVRCQNKLIDVELPIPDPDDALPSVGDAVSKMGSASKADGVTLSLSKPELLAFLHNCRAVAVRERSEIVVKHSKKATELTVETTNGKTKATLEGSGKTQEFAVDYEYFEDFVRRAPDTLELTVVDDAFLRGQGESASFVVALNQMS